MIWHEVTFVYHKGGGKQAWRSGTVTAEDGERPQSKQYYHRGESTYIEYYPDEGTAEQAIEDFEKTVAT